MRSGRQMETKGGILNPTLFSYQFSYGHAVSLRFDSKLYAISLMMNFLSQIRTFKPIEEIQRYHDPPAASFSEIQQSLDERFASTLFKTNASSSHPSHIQILAASQESPQPSPGPSPSALVETVTPVEGMSPSGSSVRLEDLALEFGVAADLVGGMRYLDEMVRRSEEFKDLVNWDSTMGRCAVFYWTCSVLKVSGYSNSFFNRYCYFYSIINCFTFFCLGEKGTVCSFMSPRFQVPNI